MKGYELIQKLVDELSFGSQTEFAKMTGVHDSYVSVTMLRKSGRILPPTLRRIEEGLRIRIIICDGEYKGWVPREQLAAVIEVEQKAMQMKVELRAIVEEAEMKGSSGKLVG